MPVVVAGDGDHRGVRRPLAEDAVGQVLRHGDHHHGHIVIIAARRDRGQQVPGRLQ